MRKAAQIVFGILLFLLPLKFSVMAATPEVPGNFPVGWLAVTITAWPVTVFGVFSALGLLLAAGAYPPARPDWKNPAFLCAALWGGAVPLAGLFGVAGARTFDFAVLTLTHLSAIAAMVWTGYLVISGEPEKRRRWIVLIACAALLQAALGLDQYFVGLEETRKALAEEIAKGLTVNPDILTKMNDDRVFTTFTSSGMLAGFLLLTFPVALLQVWRWCARVEQTRAARAIFITVTAGVFLTVIAMTKSRAAGFALIVGAVVAAFALPWKRRWKITVAVLAVAAIATSAYYIQTRGRKFYSMQYRVDYLRTSAILLATHPWGAGWGEFFHRHMEYKLRVDKEAAHDPHNLLMVFASQCGVPGLLAILAALAFPAAALARRIVRRAEGWESAAMILAGFALWGFHALMDVDFMAGGTVALAAILPMLALAPPERNAGRTWRVGRWLAVIPAIPALCLGAWQTRADFEFDKLQTLCRPDGRRSPGTPSEVAAQLAETVRWRPYSAFAWGTAADYARGTGDPETAEARYRKALTLSPRPAFHHRLYDLARERGDRAEAAAQLKQMLERFPTHPQYRILAAEFAKEGGAEK